MEMFRQNMENKGKRERDRVFKKNGILLFPLSTTEYNKGIKSVANIVINHTKGKSKMEAGNTISSRVELQINALIGDLP